MKKSSLLVMMMFVGMMMFTSACSKVPAGNVGVKVHLLGGAKGVDTEELGTGRYWIGPNTDLFLFPTFQQNYIWTQDKAEGSPNDESFTFQTAEGLSVNADVGISYHLNPTMISKIFQKYRKGIDEITDIYMRNHVRDAFNDIASKFQVESVYGKGKSELITQVENKIKEQLDEEGIIVDKVYWIGSIRLPKQVIDALNSKITATQKAEQAENELRMAEADAKKKIAQARGEAEANRLRNVSMTDKMIRYEQMKNERAAINKWNGVLPATMIPGGSLPFVNLKK